MHERALGPIEIGGVAVKNRATRATRAAHATMMSRPGKVIDDLIAAEVAERRRPLPLKGNVVR